ncbi:Uncharacterised protein [uncultured archaeon]|nr:Uncharacterised protein [uncultured archaeon]
MGGGNITKQIVLVSLIIYLVVSMVAYEVYQNLPTSGILLKRYEVNRDQLSEDIQGQLSDGRNIFILMESPQPSKKFLLITPEYSIVSGLAVGVRDKVIEWDVAWYKNNYIGEKYDTLVIGYAENLGILETIIEKMFSLRYVGKVLYYTGIFSHYTVGIVFAIGAAILARKKKIFTPILIGLTMYSFEFLIGMITASSYGLEISTLSKFASISFPVLFISTILMHVYINEEIVLLKVKNMYKKVKMF